MRKDRRQPHAVVCDGKTQGVRRPWPGGWDTGACFFFFFLHLEFLELQEHPPFYPTRQTLAYLNSPLLGQVKRQFLF